MSGTLSLYSCNASAIVDHPLHGGGYPFVPVVEQLFPDVDGRIGDLQADDLPGADGAFRSGIRQEGEADALRDERYDLLRVADFQHRHDFQRAGGELFVHQTAVAHALLGEQEGIVQQIAYAKPLFLPERTIRRGDKMRVDARLVRDDVLGVVDVAVQRQHQIRFVVPEQAEHLVRSGGNDLEGDAGVGAAEGGKAAAQQLRAEGICRRQTDMAAHVLLRMQRMAELLLQLADAVRILQHLPAILRQRNGVAHAVEQAHVQFALQLPDLEGNCRLGIGERLGGAGAVFWMWVMAIIGAATAFVEATLAQLHKQEDPLYGGYRGGPAYYIHAYAARKRGSRMGRRSVMAALFALSGLICWCGISQVIGNSVSSAFKVAFGIKPLYSTIVLVAISAFIVLRRHATVKVLDKIVPVMAGCYFVITLFIIFTNITALPAVFERIFAEAFGVRQVAAGGFGAVVMNGVKRGLFSNEAGSGSAPCSAAAARTDHPAKVGLLQAFGVFIDTVVICSCTAFIMLLAPQEAVAGLEGMELLQEAMRCHMGNFGVVFIAVILWLFSFSTFVGVLFYARGNVAYLFGDHWASQTAYKVLALAMLFIGGLAAYTFVWDLGDVGIALMTLFNIAVILPMGGEALACLRDYEDGLKKK